MKEYHKIQTVFKRDMASKFKTLIEGDYSLPEFAYLANNPWVFTEKVDGTNIRVMLREMVGGSALSFGGKTDDAQIPGALVERLRTVFEPQRPKMLELFPDGVCLYGEGYGARIQRGGGNYGPTQDFVLFDVRIGQWWLERRNVEDIAQKLGLRVAPIIGEGTLAEMVQMARAGITSTWGNFQAEGIVARPKIELTTRNGDRIITKIKFRDFAR